MPGSAGDRPYVAVIGSAGGDERSWSLAEQVGRGLGERGAVLVCGGLGGVMEAACRGAKGAGGTTVGVLSGSDRRLANAWVDVALATGIGEARNAIVAGAADVVIAVSGEWGTLSEIGLALRAGKPVVGLETWELARPGVEPAGGIVRVSTPEEAVKTALGLCAGGA